MMIEETHHLPSEAEPDDVERAVNLVLQLTSCQQQLDQMVGNVELARSKAHRIVCRLEDQGVVPVRKAATESAFQKSLDDIGVLRQTIDQTLKQVVSELRRALDDSGRGSARSRAEARTRGETESLST